jgi:hypothetical protein
VTSSAVPAALLGEVVRLARAAGATVTAPCCDDRGCQAGGTEAGVDVHLAADRDTTGSWVFAADISPGPGAPLGAWSAPRVQPAAWPGTVPCAEKADAGCTAYRGTLAVPVVRDEAVTALRATTSRG